MTNEMGYKQRELFIRVLISRESGTEIMGRLGLRCITESSTAAEQDQVYQFIGYEIDGDVPHDNYSEESTAASKFFIYVNPGFQDFVLRCRALSPLRHDRV